MNKKAERKMKFNSNPKKKNYKFYMKTVEMHLGMQYFVLFSSASLQN